MKIKKEDLNKDKKKINNKYKGRARQNPHSTVYLKNSYYLELAKILNCGILVSYSS